MENETKLSRDIEQDEQEAQEMWEEVTGFAWLLSDDCEFLTKDQKDQIRLMSGYREADYEKVLHVGRKLLRNRVAEWADEIKEEYWQTKSRTLGRNRGYLGVRLRWGKWVYAVNWFRSRKTGENNFSETITIPENAKRLHPKKVDWALPQEIEAMQVAENKFVKVREVNEEIKKLIGIFNGLTLKLRHQHKVGSFGEDFE